MIAVALRNDIRSGALNPGDLVPSYRALMQRHGVAVATVRHAIGLLQSEGLIATVRGRGCVVVKADRRWDMIGVAVLAHGDSRILIEELNCLQKAFEARRCDIALRLVHPLSRVEIHDLPRTTPRTKQARSRLTEADLDGLMAWARRLGGVMLSGDVTDEVIRRILELKLNCVVIGHPKDRESAEGLSMVTPDVESLMDLAVGYLAELGHRRILLVSGDGSWYFDKLAACFHDSMRGRGLETGADPFVWYSGVDGAAGFGSVFDLLPVKPTAIIAEEAVRADSIVRDLAAAGYAVPGDVSVMAISESAASAYVPTELTSVVTPTRTLLLRATEIMLKLLHAGTKTVYEEKLAGRLVFGKTCAAPSPGGG
jgi:DNA-binding transcriptional regulator YhcF (GntR family)